MKHFEKCGFKRRGQRADDRGRRAVERPGMASEGQIRKIKAMWYALGGSYYKKGAEWRALRGFLKKRYRVDHEIFLTAGMAQGVIEAIKKIQARQRRVNKSGQK